METLIKGLSSTEALRQVQIGFAVSTATDAAKSDPDQARDPAAFVLALLLDQIKV